MQVSRDDVVFVSSNLYGGSIRPGVLNTVIRMNFNAPFPRRNIASGTSPPENADYAVLSFDEYQRWLTTTGADPDRAVVSDDRAVALVCLRAPCVHR